MHCLYLGTGTVYLHVLTLSLRYRQIKQVVSVCICMYWSIDTDRYALLVSRHRHVVFMLYPEFILSVLM
jgi:hypothetical protein